MICIYIYIFFFFFFPLTDPTSGNSIDYTYDKLGVVHSYCVELRPGEEDRQGFFASACEISQTGREILVAFRAITPILAKQTETVDKAIFRIRKNKRKKWKRREKNRRRKERNDDSTTGWLRILSLLEGLDGVMALRLTVKIW